MTGYEPKTYIYFVHLRYGEMFCLLFFMYQIAILKGKGDDQILLQHCIDSLLSQNQDFFFKEIKTNFITPVLWKQKKIKECWESDPYIATEIPQFKQWI